MPLIDYFGLVASAFAAGLALRHVARLRFDPNTRFTTPGEAKAQGGFHAPRNPSCVNPDQRFHATNISSQVQHDHV